MTAEQPARFLKSLALADVLAACGVTSRDVPDLPDECWHQALAVLRRQGRRHGFPSDATKRLVADLLYQREQVAAMPDVFAGVDL